MNKQGELRGSKYTPTLTLSEESGLRTLRRAEVRVIVMRWVRLGPVQEQLELLQVDLALAAAVDRVVAILRGRGGD